MLPIPNLPTLNLRPSWLNNQNNPDRSAVLELRAKETWPLIPLMDWTITPTFPTPAKTRPNAKTQKLLAATIIITSHQLNQLHNTRQPFPLQGDLRTTKSNALKHNHTKQTDSLGNPNRGATQTKKLGLPYQWTQPIKLERWRLNKILTRHYLLCPTCDRKANKLFLTLCTQQEADDATQAHHYLTQLNELHPNKPYTQPQADLASRYHPLFPTRSLQCVKCLNLKYGEAKPPRQPPQPPQ